jgi:hypothetical protein
VARTNTRSLAHLEPVELLGELYPELTFGDRVVWLLMVAEVRRSGQLPSIETVADRMRRAGVTGRYHKRTVQRMIARLYDCGAMTRGSYRYAEHTSLDERVYQIFPILRLLEVDHVAA